MDIVTWSLSAFDYLYSTRKSGSGETSCPDGTYAAGYTQDYLNNWKVMCLTVLTIEDTEDVYLFVAIITGFLLIWTSIALVYRKNCKTAEIQGANRLPAMLIDLGRAVSTLNGAINELKRDIETTLEKAVNAQTDANTEVKRNGETILEMDRQMDMILDRLTTWIAELRRYGDNNIEIDRKLNIMMERITALYGGPGNGH